MFPLGSVGTGFWGCGFAGWLALCWVGLAVCVLWLWVVQSMDGRGPWTWTTSLPQFLINHQVCLVVLPSLHPGKRPGLHRVSTEHLPCSLNSTHSPSVDRTLQPKVTPLRFTSAAPVYTRAQVGAAASCIASVAEDKSYVQTHPPAVFCDIPATKSLSFQFPFDPLTGLGKQTDSG